MIDEQSQLLIRTALTKLVSAYTLMSEQIERTVAVLSQVLEVDDGRRRHGTWMSPPKSDMPIADRETLTVSWRGKSCFLGNTLLFLFVERIARSPNRYIAHVDLLEDVWGGERQAATIRGVVKRLKERLRENDMPQLADAIDGSVRGHYGLMLV